MFDGKTVSLEELAELVKLEEEMPCEADHEEDRGKHYWNMLHSEGPGEWYLIIECPCEMPSTMLVCQNYKDIAVMFMADSAAQGRPYSCQRCANPVNLRVVKKGG